MHVVDDCTDVASWQHGGETRERVDVGPAPRTIQRDHDRCRCQCNFIASTLWTPVTVRLYSIGDCFLLKASACLEARGLLWDSSPGFRLSAQRARSTSGNLAPAFCDFASLELEIQTTFCIDVRPRHVCTRVRLPALRAVPAASI
jgi:hypothetical protein